MASKYQKRHYEDIVAILRNELENPYGPEGEDTIRDLIDTFAATFAADNPLFNRERFLEACGVDN